MKLSELRQDAGLTVLQVAKQLNVSKECVYHYERGIRQLNLTHVLTLSKLYGVSTEEVIEAQLNSLKDLKDSQT